MADQSPLDQVEAVVDGSAGEALKGRSGAEVIFADSDNGWIRVEPLDYWVVYDGHLSDEAALAFISWCTDERSTEIDQPFYRALSRLLGTTRCGAVRRV